MIRNRGLRLRGEREKDVVGVGAEGHDQRACPLDAGLQQRVFIGRVAGEEQVARVGRVGNHVRFVLDHHERDLASGQFLRECFADAAVSADDRVVVQVVNFAMHASHS